MENLLYKVAITKIPLVGAVTAKSLISYCGGVKEVFEAKKAALLKIPGIGNQIASNILNQKVLKESEKELEFLEKNNVQPLFYLDKNFPRRLKHYHDCPTMLYYKGEVDLNQQRIVAIVGTRKPSVHGVAICEEIVEDLKHYKPIIISGLAYGIDVTAHKKSVELGIPTVGVLGHGLGRIYPAQHRKVAEEMVAGGGGLLTEYTSSVQPDREHFPMRNRIVAGLCDALIVVETANRGGSIITAKQANSYNKDVFAIPGRIRDKKAEGCNKLIKQHRANLMESVEDIAYVLGWEHPDEIESTQPKLFPDLSENEKIIIDILQEKEEAGVDKLSFESKINNSDMAAILLELEFKGLVRTLPGKRYVLV